MSELDRLLLSSDDELERALLGSALSEAPSSAGLRDTALALGLTASTATALVATLPSAASALGAEATSVVVPLGATAGAPTVAASSAAAVAGAASLTTVMKGLVGGALVTFLALTTVDHTLQPSTPEPARRIAMGAGAQVESPLAAPRTTGAAPEAAASAPSPAPVVDGTTLDPRPRRPASRATPVPAVPAPLASSPARATFEVDAPRAETASAASLAAETRLLDRARSALARGDTGGAAQLLEQYYAARPSAVLSHEAALLRVRLLLATGQRAAAAEQARRIISLYPRNAHADSLRRLAAER